MPLIDETIGVLLMRKSSMPTLKLKAVSVSKKHRTPMTKLIYLFVL